MGFPLCLEQFGLCLPQLDFDLRRVKPQQCLARLNGLTFLHQHVPNDAFKRRGQGFLPGSLDAAHQAQLLFHQLGLYLHPLRLWLLGDAGVVGLPEGGGSRGCQQHE